jgi:hypothetical protein
VQNWRGEIQILDLVLASGGAYLPGNDAVVQRRTRPGGPRPEGAEQTQSFPLRSRGHLDLSGPRPDNALKRLMTDRSRLAAPEIGGRAGHHVRRS